MIDSPGSGGLSGRTAFVTGSTTGIGAAIAAALAGEGARVLISGRDAERAHAVADDIRSAGGRADILVADLSCPPLELRRLAETALAALGGRVDVLVNNAGGYAGAATHALPDEEVDRLLHVNVRAPHALVGALAPGMIGHGGGIIINIGSWMGSAGHSAGALYTATKAAVEQLTRSWAAEYGPQGIRVNAVAPGATATESNAAHHDVLDALTRPTPAGRPMTPVDIAQAVAFLASDASVGVHGEVLRVDGGILTTWRA